MSQAENRTTTIPSRRALLTGAPAVAAAALAAGTAATGLATAMAAPLAADPIFAVIAEHKEAAEAYNQAIAVEVAVDLRDDPDLLTTSEATREAGERAHARLLEVLTVKPTTLPGVVALLVHVGQPELIEESHCEDRDTFLSAAGSGYMGETKAAAMEFPRHIANVLARIA